MERLIAAALLLALSACSRGDESEFREPVHLAALEQLLATGPATVRIGSAADSISAFRRIAAARLSPDGSRIGVLDRDPPFLRLIAADGRPVASVVQRGQGPTESTDPAALALSSDAAVLADPGALIHVSLETREVRRLPPIDVRVQGIDFGCGGRWLAYGPSRVTPRRYIHELTIDTVVSVIRSSFADTTGVRRAWGGVSPHVMARSTGALIEHRTQAYDRILAVDCVGDVQSVPWGWALGTLPSETMSGEEHGVMKGNEMALRVDPAVPFSVGRAVIGGELLWLESRFAFRRKPARSLEDGEHRTYVYLVGEKGMHVGYIVGLYVLHDFRAGRLLLSTEHDYPILLAVPWSDFRETLAGAEWRGRN